MKLSKKLEGIYGSYGHWVRFYFIGYGSLFAMAQIFYANFMFSFTCGLGIFLFTDRYKKYLKEKHKKILRDQFKDLLYSLSASLATGRQLQSSLKDAAVNLGVMYSADSPLLVELKGMIEAMEENRESEEQLLMGFAQRSDIEDISNFVDVYLSCRQTGGDLNIVVSNASATLMEKMMIEREIKVMTSQKQFEGKIISAMPVLVIMLLNVASPGYLEKLYDTIPGRIIMTIALAGICLSYVMTDRIMKIEA